MVYPEKHNPHANDLTDSVIGNRVDRRDERARQTPDRWQPQGSPRTANEQPGGGCVPASVYHDKGHFSPTNGAHPMPLR